jgi:gas vesicle protein
MQKALNLALGFVLGGLVGSALTLLLTPMSGDEMQSEIREYTRMVKQEVEDAAAARRMQLEYELSRLRGEVETY